MHATCFDLPSPFSPRAGDRDARLRWALVALVALALASSGCANTGGGGGGGGNDAGAGSDSAGSDSAGGGTDTGGSDTGGGGQAVTIEALQKEMEKLDCTANAFTNGPKGVKLVDVVVATPINFKAIKGKNGDSDATFVQDKGGGLWKGIYVTGANGGALGKLKIGDVVTLEGEVKDYYCATQMDAKTITPKTGATELPVAVTLTIDKIGDKASDEDNEAAEGVLVSIENVVVSDNEPLGNDKKPHGEFYVGKDKDDKSVLVAPAFGTTFSKKGADGLFRADFPIGKEFKSIRGVLTFSFSKWRLLPIGDKGLDHK